MKLEVYKGMEVDIFDMYGMVDIRATESNRTAQIFRDNKEWQLHLYWIENGELNIHNETMFFDNKPDTVTAGKDWVVGQIREKGGECRETIRSEQVCSAALQGCGS